jgi:molybdate transport system ATP-binding protein
MKLELSRLNLQRGERTVLRDINWRIEPGQHWVLLGGNGAGKTQLLKLLAGDVWPVERAGSFRRYQLRGAAHDEPAAVKEHIAYVGAERQDRYAHYEWNFRVSTVVGTGLQRSDIPLAPFTAADRLQIAACLRGAGIAELASRRFLSLSYGQRRLTLLARALAWRPLLLLLDEPLNGLDADHRQQVLRLIAGIRRSLPLVVSTHRAEDVPAHTTHLLELRNGRVHWQGKWRRGQHPSLSVEADARRGARQRAVPARVLPRAARGTASQPQIVARNASVWLARRLVLRQLNFSVESGDCWVVHGANGSGKSTLIRALYGDLGVASQGEIRRRGIEAGVPISEFKARVGVVAPELQTLHPLYLQVAEVVASGLHSSVGMDFAPTADERRAALRALRLLGAAGLARRPLRELSYGQLRRVLFARALVHRPAILLLDEPYTGLDARVRQRLRRRVDQYLSQGGTVVLTTHHPDEWPTATTHELLLRNGRAAYCGTARRS